MSLAIGWFVVSVALVFPHLGLAQQAVPPVWNASGQNGAVASGEREATEAGLEMLRGGGNAADAAAATLLV